MKNNFLAIIIAIAGLSFWAVGCSDNAVSNQDNLSWATEYQDPTTGVEYGSFAKVTDGTTGGTTEGVHGRGHKGGRRGHGKPGTDSLHAGCRGIADSLVPQVIRDNFAAKFPGVIASRWSKKDSTYSVRFISADSVKSEAVYDLLGNLLLIEKHIAITSLPQAITDKISADFAGYTVKHAEIVEDLVGAKTTYEVIVISTSSVGYKLEYDATGTLISQKELRRRR